MPLDISLVQVIALAGVIVVGICVCFLIFLLRK